jgi:TolB protein
MIHPQYFTRSVLRFLIFLFLSVLCFDAVLLNAAVTDLGKLSREGVVVRPIAIKAYDPQTQNLLERAFKLHGGIQLVDASKAAFVLDFKNAGANTTTLTILSGNPPQTLFMQTITNSDSKRRVLLAADLAIEKIMGAPGFFAGKIAFVGEKKINKRDIYVSDLFFQRVENVTNEGVHAVSPNWSPDGKSILYTSYIHSGSADIYKIDMTARRRAPFAVYKGTNISPVYSHDGSRVAMMLSGGKGATNLYISDRTGRSPQRYSRTRFVETSPTWSPDGSKIVFASDALGNPQLFQIDVARKSAPQRLPIKGTRYSAEPAWNPVHANLIAYTFRSDNGFQIGLYDSATGQTRQVTKGPHEAVEPSWLRDGRHLLFTERRGYNQKLSLVDSATGKIVSLPVQGFSRTSQADYVY